MLAWLEQLVFIALFLVILAVPVVLMMLPYVIVKSLIYKRLGKKP